MQFSKTKRMIFHHFSGNKMVHNLILFPREKQRVLLRGWSPTAAFPIISLCKCYRDHRPTQEYNVKQN